jgi:hypothetical protein
MKFCATLGKFFACSWYHAIAGYDFFQDFFQTIFGLNSPSFFGFDEFHDFVDGFFTDSTGGFVDDSTQRNGVQWIDQNA